MKRKRGREALNELRQETGLSICADLLLVLGDEDYEADNKWIFIPVTFSELLKNNRRFKT